MDNQQFNTVTNICQPKKNIHLKSLGNVLSEREQKVENAINAIMNGTVLPNKSGNLTDTTFSKSSGIYLMVNKVNGKWYVGSAKNICRRIRNGHRYDLLHNRHGNSYITKVYKKYGLDVFIILELEYISIDILKNIEQEYLDIAKHNKPCVYNLKFNALRWDPNDTNKLNMSEATKKLWLNPKYREACSNKKERNGNYKPVLPEVYELLKVKYYQYGAAEMRKLALTYDIRSNKAIRMCKEFRELKCNIPRLFNAKKWSNERKDAQSNRLRDTRIFTFKNLETDETFQGIIYDFYTKYNLNPTSVRNLTTKTRKSTGNWVLFNN